MSKQVVIEIHDILRKWEEAEITYDRALEEGSKKVKAYCSDKPIVGIVNSGRLKAVLKAIVSTKVKNVEKSYLYDVQIHQNEMAEVERMITALYEKDEEKARKDYTLSEFKIHIKGILTGKGIPLIDIMNMMDDRDGYIEGSYYNNLSVEQLVLVFETYYKHKNK